jgi:1,4-alpha-glucan branching enzyme
MRVQALALIGEFNDWDPKPEHWAVKNDFGVWSLFLPDSEDGVSAIPHRQAPDQERTPF